MEYRRQIAVVFTLEDALKKVNNMRMYGFSEHEIHIFAKDIQPMQSLKMNTEIDIHQAGNLFEKIQSMVWGMDLYEVCLRKLQFSEAEVHHYGRVIEQGAIFMVAQHDLPFEKQKKAAFAPNAPEGY